MKRKDENSHFIRNRIKIDSQPPFWKLAAILENGDFTIGYSSKFIFMIIYNRLPIFVIISGSALCYVFRDFSGPTVSIIIVSVINKVSVWSKIIFSVWLAFAVKIVVARNVELNLAWFTRYEPQKSHSDDVTAFSLTRPRAMFFLPDSSPKVFRAA